MPFARPLHSLLRPLLERVLVALLVACSFACCCQQRTLGALFAADDAAPAAASCCDGCCARENAAATAADAGADDRADRAPGGRERHPAGRCDAACCTKADIKAPQFALECDRVGAPLDAIVAVDDAPCDRTGEAMRLDDDVGEPPPWLLLLVSARLRI